MITLKEGLLNKKNIKDIKFGNKYGITQKDMKGDIEGFPVGIVIRMLEETEKHGNEPDVKVFQDYIIADRIDGGFDWIDTDDGISFWNSVINNFDNFYRKYPEYKKYDR